MITGEEVALLFAQVDATTSAAWAKRTDGNYGLHQRRYFAFCSMFGFNWRRLNHRLLCAFAQFLSREFQSPRAVENYLTGVKWFYIFREYDDISAFSHPGLKLFFKGLAGLMQLFPKQAAPFTKDIWLKLRAQLDLVSNVNDIAFCVLWC